MVWRASNSANCLPLVSLARGIFLCCCQFHCCACTWHGALLPSIALLCLPLAWWAGHKALLPSIALLCLPLARQCSLHECYLRIAFWTAVWLSCWKHSCFPLVKIGHTLEGWRNRDILTLAHLVAMVSSVPELRAPAM